MTLATDILSNKNLAAFTASEFRKITRDSKTQRTTLKDDLSQLSDANLVKKILGDQSALLSGNHDQGIFWTPSFFGLLKGSQLRQALDKKKTELEETISIMVNLEKELEQTTSWTRLLALHGAYRKKAESYSAVNEYITFRIREKQADFLVQHVIKNSNNTAELVEQSEKIIESLDKDKDPFSGNKFSLTQTFSYATKSIFVNEVVNRLTLNSQCSSWNQDAKETIFIEKYKDSSVFGKPKFLVEIDEAVANKAKNLSELQNQSLQIRNNDPHTFLWTRIKRFLENILFRNSNKSGEEKQIQDVLDNINRVNNTSSIKPKAK